MQIFFLSNFKYWPCLRHFCSKSLLIYSIVVLALCLSKSVPSYGGPINQQESFPAAAMNESGDFIAAGNWRTLMRWKGNITRASEDLSNHPDLIFTVGIASRSLQPIQEKRLPVAIACDSKSAIGFIPSDDPQDIKGQWIAITPPAGGSFGDIRCTMSPNGKWAILDIINQTLHTNSSSMPLAALGQMASITANEELFIIASKGQGLISFYHDGSGFQASSLPISYWDESLRIAAGDTGIIVADSAYAAFNTLKSNDLNRLGPSLDLPIHPGDEDYKSVPSVWYAADGTWMIGGFWGIWSGQKNDLSAIKRLYSRVDAGRSGGFAMVHSGSDGEFLSIGNSDGDLGSINALQKPYKTENSTGIKLTGFISKHIRQDDEQQKHWWQKAIGLDEAISMLKEAIDMRNLQKAKIAIIDTGSDLSHPALLNYFSNNPRELPDGLDNDANGVTDDITGYDFVMDQSRPLDKHGHGSHVSGLIVNARANSDETIKDEDQSFIKLLSLRAIDQAGKSNSIDLARAINNATDTNVDIINCSWGGGRPTVALETAFQRAYEHGALIITSAGNDSANNDEYPVFPAYFPGIISVGSINSKRQLSDFSNWGQKSVDFLAPGENIWSSYLDQGWAYMSGTSMAAPITAHVAGVMIAALKTYAPKQTKVERRQLVASLLCESATPLKPKARSKCGAIDAKKAVKKLIDFLNRA